MALTRPSSDFISTTLSGALAAAADTATIGTGLSIPTTNSYLQIDYDSTTAVGSDNGPETIFYASYNSGTGALTGIVRGQAGTTDVAHANGAKVQCAMSTAFLEGFVGASATLSANQENITDATWTKILLDSETYDVGANFASNKFTAPVNGYYLVNANVEFINLVANKIYASGIYKNGTRIKQTVACNGSDTAGVSCPICDVIYLDATEYVELYAWDTVGANTVDINNGSANTYLTVTLIKEV